MSRATHDDLTGAIRQRVALFYAPGVRIAGRSLIFGQWCIGLA
ncbi:hypothetical protein [Pacificitalea manganoxidans]|nr:hypothetical protein [Pacificitalea manganoxidans]MDR6307427.1 hypothetical protein [Pacificitalea manganoxidans]